MKVTKMHGLGNDFIVFSDPEGADKDYSQAAIKWCDRRTGIGADGLVIILPSDKADIRMRIINADGSEAEMCGNGIRCFAKYAYDHKEIDKTAFTIETLAGIMKPTLTIEGGQVKSVTVDMGKPFFSPQDIPMKVNGHKVLQQSLQIDGQNVEVASVLLGVPHTEVFVDNITIAPVSSQGPLIETHPLFPRKTNVNYVEVVNDHHIKVRTWERGAGATLACGTGSCASAVMAFEKGYTGREVDVELYLGTLHISYQEDGTVLMTGPAQEVFQTHIDI